MMWLMQYALGCRQHAGHALEPDLARLFRDVDAQPGPIVVHPSIKPLPTRRGIAELHGPSRPAQIVDVNLEVSSARTPAQDGLGDAANRQKVGERGAQCLNAVAMGVQPRQGFQHGIAP